MKRKKKNRPTLSQRSLIKSDHLGSKILFGFIVLLLILITILFLFQLKVFEKKTVVLIALKDECSLLLNNLIHTIKTADNCRMLCLNECESQNLDYVTEKFSLNSTSCNSCNCYCK